MWIQRICITLKKVVCREGVLEDAFMTTRCNNPTFGVKDLARSGERMHDDKEPGQGFREFVKLYVETMKKSWLLRRKILVCITRACLCQMKRLI